MLCWDTLRRKCSYLARLCCKQGCKQLANHKQTELLKCELLWSVNTGYSKCNKRYSAPKTAVDTVLQYFENMINIFCCVVALELARYYSNVCVTRRSAVTWVVHTQLIHPHRRLRDPDSCCTRYRRAVRGCDGVEKRGG